MPGNRRILTIAISYALFGAAAVAQAAEPMWDCRASASGWECSKAGEVVSIPTVDPSAARVTPLSQPAPLQAEQIAPAAPAAKAAAVAAPLAASVEPATTDSQPTVASEPAMAEPAATIADDSAPAEAMPEPVEETPAQPAEQTVEPLAEAQAEPVTSETSTSEAAEAVVEDTGRDYLAPVESSPATPLAAPAAVMARPEPVDEPAAEVAASEATSETAAVAVIDDAATDSAVDAPSVEAAASEPAVLQSALTALAPGAPGCQLIGQMPVRQAAVSADELLTRVSAEGAEIDQASGEALFSGDVQLDYGDQQVSADELRYHQNDNRLQASGNFIYQRPGLTLTAEQADIKLDSETGQLTQVGYLLPESRARGNAEKMALTGPGQTRYQSLNYSTCPAGNSDWVLQAESLELDQNTGIGYVEHAKLRFMGVPIAYVPRASFPIDDRRKSGFLLPSIGQSTLTGVDISTPYYLNLAPNYDATLTPRIMSKRGLLLGGEFRYLSERHSGELQAEILPNDDAYSGSGARGAASLRHHSWFNPRWEGRLDLNYASDADYLEDLGKSLAVTSTRQVERVGEMRYHGGFWSLLGRVQQYQTLDQSIAPTDRPYSRLPQIQLNASHAIGQSDFTAHLVAEYSRFDHASKVDGQRLDLAPAISYDWRTPWAFVTPRIGVRHTRYDLNKQTAGLPSKPERSSASFSLDSGLFFEREARWFGADATQTLEPRAFYLYNQRRNQSALPVFDTSEVDFSFSSLFRENRFSGADRVGDANQLTLALTSRMLNNGTGIEQLRASLGGIAYFDDRTVQLPGTATATDDSSALVAELAARLDAHWRAQAALQYNPHASIGEHEKSLLRVGYRDQRRRLFNAAYRFNRLAGVEQTDLSAYWPVSHSTRLVGRWNYSLQDEQTLEALAGVEYGRNCCWRVRALVRDYRTDASSNSNLSILLQLELTGLGQVGDSIDSQLDRSIYGYSY